MDQNKHSVAPEFPSTDRMIIDIKQFERILGKMQECDVEGDEFREEMWRVVPGLSPAEVKFICKELVRDFELIETGHYQSPNYADDLVSSGSNSLNSRRNATAVGKRKKGIPWSEEEKALFTEGLKMFGKGHWREISQYFVTSRTPRQVGNYGNKYFLSLNMAAQNKQKGLAIFDLVDRNHESPSSSYLPIPTSFQIPQQQQSYEAPVLAPKYLLECQFNKEQSLPNFSSLPPFQLDQQALPPSQFSQRFHSFKIPQQQQSYEAPSRTPKYLLECEFNEEQSLPNFSSLPPLQLDQQALPPTQFSQRFHRGALVPDPANLLEHQSRPTGYTNQRQHLYSWNSTQPQFYQPTHGDPLFRSEHTHAELQSKTGLVNLEISDSSSAAPMSESGSCPSPTTPTTATPRWDQDRKIS